MKTIVLTGGGTAGHVSPNLALLPHLLAKGYSVHYIGTDGIEKGMMQQDTVAYHEIRGGKLRRYLSVQNLTDMGRVMQGIAQSYRLLQKIRPDIVFSKGGFVAVPVVLAASMLRIPIVCHESDITPGLATKISLRFAQTVCTSFPECAMLLGHKAVQTGTPLRGRLFEGSRERGLALAGFGGAKPVLLMMGGSQGAQAVNQALREALPLLLPHFDILHLCGQGNLDKALADTPGYCQKEFLSDALPDALAACDIVLSRSGANALCEFHALKKPMLLVPLPLSASRGDQILNAKSYAARGLARVLPQEEMTGQSLAGAIEALYRERDGVLAAMAAAPADDGTANVLRQIEEVLARHARH